MSELEKWLMVVAVRAATTGETVHAVARKSKRTRRKTITVRAVTS